MNFMHYISHEPKTFMSIKYNYTCIQENIRPNFLGGPICPHLHCQQAKLRLG